MPKKNNRFFSYPKFHIFFFVFFLFAINATLQASTTEVHQQTFFATKNSKPSNSTYRSIFKQPSPLFYHSTAATNTYCNRLSSFWEFYFDRNRVNPKLFEIAGCVIVYYWTTSTTRAQIQSHGPTSGPRGASSINNKLHILIKRQGTATQREANNANS